jgi:ketosteroid isomerase-like protein
MSQTDVEAIRQVYAALNGGDIGRFLALADPDFEGVVPPELSAEPDVYRGHDGIRRYFQVFQDAMDDIHFEPERFWDTGRSVVVAVRLTAKGRHTEIPVELQMAQVWTIRDSKAIQVLTYPELVDALSAEGLSE